MRRALGLAAGSLALLLAAASGPALAQKTINLTAIDGYPPKASWVREFIKFYIPEVDKRLAATGTWKINWNQAWSGQIAKTRHVFQGMQKNLGDIGVVTTVFHADKVPLQNLTFVTPFVTTDTLLASRTMGEMAKRFSDFTDTFARYNQVYLTAGCVLDSYQMFTKEPVSSTDGFRGMKVAGAGVNLRYLQGLSAAGVGGSLVSFYNKLKTGVVSGAMLWPEAVVRFKIVEVAPHMLKADLGTVCSKVITANVNSWNKLPAEVRTVISQVGAKYADRLATEALRRGKGALGKFEKKGGKIVELSAGDRRAWAKNMPNIAKLWAESLEKKGIPGKAILSAYMDIMRKNDQPILRHWDRE